MKLNYRLIFFIVKTLDKNANISVPCINHSYADACVSDMGQIRIIEAALFDNTNTTNIFFKLMALGFISLAYIFRVSTQIMLYSELMNFVVYSTENDEHSTNFSITKFLSY